MRAEPEVEGVGGGSLAWTLVRFTLALVGSWLLVRWTLPQWAAVLMPLGEGLLRTLEPWPLTTDTSLMDDGVTLQVMHVYQHRVPKAISLDLLSLSYGIPIWVGLAVAVPGLPWRRRLRDLTAGWFILAISVVVALAARVHHMYGTIEQAPFPQMFDNWRGWTAYFVNMFFLEVGFFVLPLGLAMAFHRQRWAASWRPWLRRRPEAT